MRGSVNGPLGDSIGVSISAGTQARDGFTVNEVTGNDLDSRSATFGKAQLIWVPSQNWEARVIFSAERDRDGDYALMDLTAARERPFVVQRDFEGYTDRDVRATTVTLRGDGERLSFTSSTDSSAGTPRTPPTSTTRRCRWRPGTTPKTPCSSRRRSGWRRRRTPRSS